ncbi:hypothetical protein [Rhodoferax saidenbachensis]|uniref:Uncharacterized protein n=1 Tax=Rhodoferax saidenbachensis TaxID=1484693 RepID=A0ABU1ZNB4_9BURK|nr:hypothetical protein [Rhodoferax saidenbachensis]MDR7306431.1 hypothetical protein [Rhodoferax saidenbachensis]
MASLLKQLPFTVFEFLKKRARTAPESLETTSAEPAVRRMELEERKAYRRERLYQSIRETFLSMEVVSQMYRFKVMPVDERHHRFIAMIDVAKSFVTGPNSKTKSFAAMEHSMRINTYKRFGVLIDGIYWRVSETEEHFERHSRSSDPARSDGFEPVAHSAPEHISTGTLSRAGYHAISAEEQAAFMEALQRGATLPAVHVGDLEYQSDLAPLDGGIMIGGTQYGKL